MAARDNGLPQGSSWTRLADLDPVLADRLVEVLGDAGVAAYADASTEGPLPVPLSTPVTSRPSDRVFVGQDDLDKARLLMLHHLPALHAEQDEARVQASGSLPADMDVEAEFATIVAGFDGPQDPVGAWSALEDLPPGGDPTGGETAAPHDTWGATTAPEPRPLSTAPEDPQDHFVPPPPPPLPRGDRVSNIAWGCLVGGPVLLVVAALAGHPLGGWAGLLVVAATLGGFATLVARMKERPNRDDDPDDGAVV